MNMSDYTIGFVLEQTLGHRTHTQNLREAVPMDPSVRPLWGLIDFETAGLSARLPLYRSNWTVRAGLRARRAIRRMAHECELDALFIHTQVAAVLAGPWLKRIPAIVSLDATPTQYDVLGKYYDHERESDWVERQKWRLNVNCFQRARHLVTWSQWAKDGLVEDYGVPRYKVSVIPPGIRPCLWKRAESRHPHQNPLRILFVGGDFERKGGQLLLQSFRELRVCSAAHAATNESTLELHLVTRTPIAPEAGVFVYNEMQPNSQQLIQLFHACDIFCLPTWGDCLPMVLSEAAAAGLPIVATQVGAIGEIVHEGGNGFLIAPGDSEALTERLQRLTADPALRLQMGEAGTALAQQSFDAERNALQLVALLKDIATTSR